MCGGGGGDDSGSLFTTLSSQKIIPPEVGQSWDDPDRINDSILLLYLPT